MRLIVNRRREASSMIVEASHVLCDHGYLRKGWCHDCDAPSSQADGLVRSSLSVDDLAVGIATGPERVSVAGSLLDAVRRVRWLV